MPSVCILCTSASQFGDNPTGAWLEEVATPYYAFLSKGCQVTVASIKGGVVPIDKASMGGNFFTEDCKKFSEDESAQKALNESEKLEDVDLSAYDCLYLAGGHGCCVDFIDNPIVKSKCEYMFNTEKKVLAADCHGPIALLECVKADGEPLVKGLTVTGFSDSEEGAMGSAEKVPYLIEAKMIEQGGNYKKAESMWSPHAVRDGLLVTGQNPASSAACAKIIIEAIEEVCA